MDFRLLGPLEVAGDGDGGPTAPIGTGRQRALLALLVLHANETLTSDRLIGELWGTERGAERSFHELHVRSETGLGAERALSR